MNRDYEILTLAALLHDVGKFVQRANYYESKNGSKKFERVGLVNLRR